MAITRFRDEYFFLSNFYPHELKFHGMTFLNSEAAFQAERCCVPVLSGRCDCCGCSAGNQKRGGLIPCGTLDIHGAPVELSPSQRTRASTPVWKRTGEDSSMGSTFEGSGTTKTPSAVTIASTTMAWTCVGAAAVSLLANVMPDLMPVRCQCRHLGSIRESGRPTLLTKWG